MTRRLCISSGFVEPKRRASRVRKRRCRRSLPSEPDVRVSPHPAQAFQTLLAERTDYNRRFNITAKPSVTTYVVRSAPAYSAVSCFLLCTDSTAFHVEKDQHRSLLVFTPSNVATRILVITTRHSLFRLSHTRTAIGFSCERAFPDGSNTGFPRSA